MLPKSFYVNLFTPKAQAQALEKEGALIVRLNAFLISAITVVLHGSSACPIQSTF